MGASAAAVEAAPGGSGLLDKLNGPWHRRALLIYAFIVIAHWSEHLAQAVQIWGLGWALPDSRGVLGLAFPWLVTSEWLHYGYAAVMLVSFAVLLPGFRGRSRVWWTAALGIQIWHHFEHLLLIGQAGLNRNLLGNEVPTSIVQLVVPRVELHLIYNALVTIPMIVAVWLHMRPSKAEAEQMDCGCAHRHGSKRAQPAPAIG